MEIKAKDPSTIGAIIKKHLPELEHYETTYKHLHRHPELSTQEVKTAEIAARHLQMLGYEVTAGIGGHGVTGVLRNGEGKTVLLRADMDGLPVREESGLPYASETRAIDAEGNEVPVMHACGHDMHVASLMGAATLLVRARAEWKGTLVCLFQPNEERGGGARAMVADSLYDKVPVPDIVLGQHVWPNRAGIISPVYGTFFAAADSMKITVFGRGGHGSQPQSCIDPVAIAGYIVVRLQSIVSRMVSPEDAAVVTVGSIHGGVAENIIPETVELKVNTRSFKPEVRDRVLAAIKEIVTSECRSAGAPKDPKFEQISSFPISTNDDPFTGELHRAFQGVFGEGNVQVRPRQTASEDVSELARPNNTPLVFWFFGGVDQAKWDEAVKKGTTGEFPVNHSSKFAPAIEPTLQTGIEALSVAALRFLS